MNQNDTGAPPSVVILNLVTGVWAAQAAATAARLGVPDQLASGPKTADELAPLVQANPAALYRLLRALASTGVLAAAAGGRFALTPVGECLRSDVPGSMRAFLLAETAPGHWLPWGRLEESVRSGAPATQAALGTTIWKYYESQKQEALDFSSAMAGITAMGIQAVLAAYSFAGASRVVDVGGAHGSVLAAVLQAVPGARGVLFDLPHVVAGAGPALEAAGVAARVERVGGSFFESVPEGGDVYLLKHILHDWNDEECVRILRGVAGRMAPDGRVVVIEMPIVDGGPPSPAPLLDVNMLVMLTGKERTPEEYAALFAASGLRLASMTATLSPFAVLEARRA
jgi:hypothetical protein